MSCFPGEKRLFILAEPRSGSSWLMETLNSHREIQLMTEVLNSGQPIQSLGELLNHVLNSEIKKYIGGSERDLHDCLDYLEKTLAAPREKKVRFCGCKILLNQLTLIGNGFPEKFLEFFRNALFIFLYRTNLVAEQISLQLAHKRNVWHVNQQEQIALNKISISPSVLVANLEKSLERRERMRRLLAVGGQPCLAFSYEEFFADAAIALRKIFDFLGLADRNVAFSRELKGNPFRPRQVIENFDEVRAYLESYPLLLQMLLAE